MNLYLRFGEKLVSREGRVWHNGDCARLSRIRPGFDFSLNSTQMWIEFVDSLFSPKGFSEAI